MIIKLLKEDNVVWETNTYSENTSVDIKRAIGKIGYEESEAINEFDYMAFDELKLSYNYNWELTWESLPKYKLLITIPKPNGTIRIKHLNERYEITLDDMSIIVGCDCGCGGEDYDYDDIYGTENLFSMTMIDNSGNVIIDKPKIRRIYIGGEITHSEFLKENQNVKG